MATTKNILVPIDFPKRSQADFDHAIGRARTSEETIPPAIK